MGLFRMFAGKSPESHEEKGDAYLRLGAFGDARIEFEKALHKIETRFSEKKHLAGRIREKLRSASEALARQHVENAAALAEAGEPEQAAELYGLAMGLTNRQDLQRKIEQGLQQLAPAGGPVFNGDPGTVAPQPDAGSAEEAGQVFGEKIQDTDEIFSVLCSSLPAQTAAVYRQYGSRFARGYVALNRGDFARAAEELFEALKEHNGKNTLIPLELATAYLHLEQHARALEILEAFLSENSGEIRAYQLLCEIYWEAGDFSAADRLLASAPHDMRRLPGFQMLAGETRFQAGDLPGAESAFLAYAEAHGSDEIVSRALAKTYEAAGQPEKARDLYARVMNRCASCGRSIDPFVKRRFAELSYECGETSSKLLDLFFTLVREDPDRRADYYGRIGSIYEKRGETREAARYLGLARQVGQRV